MNSRSCSGFADKTGRTAFKKLPRHAADRLAGTDEQPFDHAGHVVSVEPLDPKSPDQGYCERPLVAAGWDIGRLISSAGCCLVCLASHAALPLSSGP